MTEQRSELSTAVSLMKMALALLDKAEETGVAARLQSAIDLAVDAPIARTIEEIDAMLENEEGCRLLKKVGIAA